MLFDGRPSFRRPVSSPYPRGSIRSRLIGVPAKAARVIIIAFGWVVLLLGAIMGITVDQPMFRKGWWKVAAMIVFVVTGILIAKAMWSGSTRHFY